MNSYTLTFNSPRFENLYRKKQHDKEYQIYKFNFRFVIIMIALTIIRSLLVIDYLKVFLLVLFMAGVIIIQYLARKSYNFMDFSMFIIQLFLTFYVLYLLHIQKLLEKTSPFNIYTYGLSQGLVHYATFLGTRFYLKALGFLIYSLSIFIYIMTSDWELLENIRWLYLLTLLIAMNFLYLNEKQKRLYFMVQQQKKQWQKGLDSILDIAIIECGYDENSLQITLQKQNSQSQKFFRTNSVFDFKNFIRQISLRKQENKQLEIEQYNYFLQQSSKSKITLEQLMIKLIKQSQEEQDLNKKTKENMFEKNYQYLGYFNKKLYNLDIFFQYGFEPIVVVMFQQQEDYQKNLFYQSKIEHYQLLQQKCISLSKDLPKVIVLMKNESQIQQYSTNLSRRLKISLSILYLQYNKLLNLKCYTLKQNLTRKQEMFSLSKILKEIKFILNPLLMETNKELITNLEHINEDMKLTTTYWMLFQILLNLLINAIQYSPSMTQIFLKMESKYFRFNDLKAVKFIVKNQGQEISQQDIDQLPKINPQDLEDFIKSSKQLQLQLGLAVANKLQMIIGLEGSMKIKRREQFNYISFIIPCNEIELINENQLSKRRSLELM